MKQKSKILEQLKIFYLFVFILTALIIAPTHIFPAPYFMYARFPHYLETMSAFMGVSWPMLFDIYHYTLYLLALIGSLNVLGIIFYPKLKLIAITSSLTGLLLISLITFFLFFKFISVNPPTAIVYGFYSIILLILNWLTFKTLIRPKKEA